MTTSHLEKPQPTFRPVRERHGIMRTGIPSAANENHAKERTKPMAVIANSQPKPATRRSYLNHKAPYSDYPETRSTSKHLDGDLTSGGGLLSSPGTTAKTVYSLRDSLSTFSNQDLTSSEQMKAPQHQTTDYGKRRRTEDEDELGMPEERTRARTSPTTKIKDWDLENWPAAIVRQQAASDPDFIRHLLDAAGPESWALLMEQTISNPSFLRGLLDAGCSKAKMVGTLESKIRQEQEFHEQKEKSQMEQYTTLWKRFDALRINIVSALSAKIGANSNKEADDAIKGAWNQLAYTIKNFVSNYLTEGPLDETRILDDIRCNQHAMSTISVEERLHLRNNILRRHLWRVIYLHIFSSGGKNLYGEIGQALVHHIGQQDPRSLPSPQSLKMISVMKSIYDPALEKEDKIKDDAELEELIRGISADLQPFVPDSMMNLFDVGLKTILSEAVKIHTTMMKSKAILIVQWVRDDDGQDVPYDSDTMEFHQDGIDVNAPDHVVHLVESPAVWKIGNADGENLDSSMVLLKSSVVLKEKKALVILENKCTMNNA